MLELPQEFPLYVPNKIKYKYVVKDGNASSVPGDKPLHTGERCKVSQEIRYAIGHRATPMYVSGQRYILTPPKQS